MICMYVYLPVFVTTSQWVPEAPPPKRKPIVTTTTSLLSGFSGSSVLRETHESEVRQNVCSYNVSLVRLQWIVRTEGNT